MKKVLITGATGFLGGAVLNRLQKRSDIQIIAAVRNAGRLPENFQGVVEEGYMNDSAYRERIVKGVDVIAHTASWAAMWRHRRKEKIKFYLPTISLIDEALAAGVKRFVLTGTIAMNKSARSGKVFLDDEAVNDTGFWPHLDQLNAVDRYMKDNSHRGMQMVTLRLGHFLGRGNKLGLVPALVPRMRTRMVPWLSGGKRKMPLVTPEDLASGFEKSLLENYEGDYQSFNIIGKEFPALREVIEHISDYTGIAPPLISVPYSVGYIFAFLMEYLHPPLPGYPFLARSIVHLAEGWEASNEKAQRILGYSPQGDWRSTLEDHLDSLWEEGYPWPALKTSG